MSLSYLFFALVLLTLSGSSKAGNPRLVLQITIDGLRADLIERCNKVLSKDSFHHLINNGIVYRNAH